MKYLLLFLILTVAMNSYSSIEGCAKKVSLDNLYMKALRDSADIARRTLPELEKMQKLMDEVDSTK